MTKQTKRGNVLMSVLVILVLILMLVGVLLKRGQSGLFQSGQYRDGVRALQAARGGASHLVALLDNDDTYAADLNIALNGADYSVTFDTSNPDFSVNNLASATPSGQLNSQGVAVPPYSADLVITGKSGRAERKVHVLVQRGLTTARSVAAVGKVTLTGAVEVRGVKSLTPPPGQTDPEPAPGGIFSKFQSTSPAQPAITWLNPGGDTFTLSALSRLEAAPPKTGGESFSNNLRTTFPSQVVEDAAADSIPDIDVQSYVTAGLSSPSLAPGGSTLPGYVYVKDARSVAGDLTVNGTLSLSEGTLYVDGDLTVNGSIEGLGTIYASGDVTVVGGNAVVITDQPAGAALLAGGNVSLIGVDAGTALNDLATAHGFLPAVDRLNYLLTSYSTFDQLTYRGLAEQIGKHDGPYFPDPGTGTPPGPDSPYRPGAPINEWISPIPGLNGMHNFAQSNAATARVILSLQENYPGYASDPLAVKSIRALEQLQFFFRSNKHLIKHDGTNFTSQDGSLIFQTQTDYQLLDPSGLPIETTSFSPNTPSYVPSRPLILTAFPPELWDDEGSDPSQRTHDWQFSFGPPGSEQQRRSAFLAENALGANWLGESSFQGLVYARGDVSAATKFKVVGALISLGDVDLGNGSELVFNEDYKDLVGATLPLGLVFYEEL
jgi:hypothetical protein